MREHLQRRLAAVLAADVVGYSRMIRLDEEGTLAAFKDLRAQIIDPKLAEYEGRIVKLMGDGMLVEFPSVVGAVRAAAEAQQAVAARNAGLAEDEQIWLRVGINLGDVVIDGDDIHGDGVNVAARLEQLAEAGGICVSDMVHDQVKNRLQLTFDDLGQRELKNIPEPVRIWRWDSQAKSKRVVLPEAPSLAVLPFDNMSGDSDQDYFADGVVEDIITALSRFKSFAVVARNSSFAYKGRALDVRQIARELGVRYVLEGSVRRADGRFRITAQLVDGSSGSHLWASKFDGIDADIFDVQDRITESVVGVVEPEIREAEIERSRRDRPESLAAYDLYLRALPKLYALTPSENAAAYALLTEAIRIQPDYGLACSMAAWSLSQRIALGWPPLSPDERARCIELAEAALSLARGDATIMATSGLHLVQIGHDYERGMLTLERAVEDNPNNLHVMMRAGIGHLHCGSVEAALSHFHRAIRLSPGDPTRHWSLTGIAQAHFILCQFEEALTWAERSLALNRNYGATYWMLIGANASLGRLDEARRWLAKFRELVPGVTVARIRDGQPTRDASRMAAILEGLRLAGLEET